MTVSWIVLLASGALEAVWASALGASKGFKKLRPTLLFAVSLVVSLAGLAFALRDIPVGTGYAVWVGVGASLTTVWALVTKQEKAELLKVLFLIGLIACVIGLKLVS